MTGFMIALSIIFTTLALYACGTNEDVSASMRTNTEGQALMDLKQARNHGAINHDEYEDAKENVLDRYED